MKRRLFQLAVLLLMAASTPVFAETVQVGDARDMALSFLMDGQQQDARRAPARNKVELEEPFTIEKDGEVALYMFNGTAGGYVIVAADDACPNRILGFSDSGTIDPANMPPALSQWLDGIAGEIQMMRAADAAPTRAANVHGNIVVEPLITTQWGQGSPFNMLCPTLDGAQCVTGCAATAMAQLMNYYKWPAKGKGSISYTDDMGCGKEISVDFSQSVYDWDNMPDIYGTAATEAQKQAVATLMRDCGASIQMYYTPSGSGATIGMVTSALKRNFSYSAAVTDIYRNNYDDDDWEYMLRSELEKLHPVIYAGHTETDGHAFICDGYDDAGYFHFNFGWNGASDGWYLTSANVGFSHNQCMIYQSVPDYEGTGDGQDEEQDHFSWNLTEDGTLTILGKGTMPDDYTNDSAPWLQPYDGTQEGLKAARDKVRKVIIGKGVQNVASQLFYKYNSLTSVQLPEGLVSIDFYAFGYSALEHINIPSTLVNIDRYAFCHTNLQSVIIPATLLSIGTGAFTDCSRIGSIEVEPGNTVYSSLDGVLYNRKRNILLALPASRDYYELPATVTTLASYSIGGTNLTSFTVPEGVTMESEVFRGSEKLEKLVLPSDITSIPMGLCMYCSSLKDCPIPDGVTSIGNYAFQGCGIETFTIPDHVTGIGYYTFGSSAAKTVTLPAGLTYIDDYAFAYCYSLYDLRCKAMQAPEIRGICAFANMPTGGTLTVPTGSDYSSWLEYLPDGWKIVYTDDFDNLEDETVRWSYDESTATVTLSGKGHVTWAYTDNEWRQFKNNNEIRHLVIGPGILNIPDYLFLSTKLETVQFGEGLAEIGIMAFSFCSGLTSLELPESLTTIGKNAFSGCKGLTELTLPGQLEFISAGAFMDCSNLTAIQSRARTAPVADSSSGVTPFGNIARKGQLTVPTGSDYSSWMSILPSGWVLVESDNPGQSDDPGEDPETDPLEGTFLYVIGNDGNWNPAQASATLAYRTGDRCYAGDITISDTGNGYGYFCIGTALGGNIDDWNTFNTNRLSAPTHDCLITPGTYINCITGADNSFMAPAGVHHIVVDIAAGIIYLDCTDGISPSHSGVSEGTVYDMLGRKVSNPVPGTIYLKNGHKFLMKRQ